MFCDAVGRTGPGLSGTFQAGECKISDVGDPGIMKLPQNGPPDGLCEEGSVPKDDLYLRNLQFIAKADNFPGNSCGDAVGKADDE